MLTHGLRSNGVRPSGAGAPARGSSGTRFRPRMTRSAPSSVSSPVVRPGGSSRERVEDGRARPSSAQPRPRTVGRNAFLERGLPTPRGGRGVGDHHHRRRLATSTAPGETSSRLSDVRLDRRTDGPSPDASRRPIALSRAVLRPSSRGSARPGARRRPRRSPMRRVSRSYFGREDGRDSSGSSRKPTGRSSPMRRRHPRHTPPTRRRNGWRVPRV